MKKDWKKFLGIAIILFTNISTKQNLNIIIRYLLRNLKKYIQNLLVLIIIPKNKTRI